MPLVFRRNRAVFEGPRYGLQQPSMEDLKPGPVNNNADFITSYTAALYSTYE